jgi:hypothetical protein
LASNPPSATPDNDAREANRRAELESAQHAAAAAERGRIAAEDAAREANRRAELESAKHAADAAERRRIGAEADATRAVDEAQQQIAVERQKQSIVIAAAAGIIILLCSAAAFMFVRIRRSRFHASASAPNLALPIQTETPQDNTKHASSPMKVVRGILVVILGLGAFWIVASGAVPFFHLFDFGTQNPGIQVESVYADPSGQIWKANLKAVKVTNMGDNPIVVKDVVINKN